MPSETAQQCPLAEALAARLRESRDELTSRWLERITDRVAIEPKQVFPSKSLLDHVPLLIDGIANYMEDPSKEVNADTPVIAKAMELGALRHAQGFDAYQILKEYEILGGIVFSYLAHVPDEIAEPSAKSEVLFCGQRLFKAITLIQQATTTHYLRVAEERVAEREDRLRAFNRSISHEVKNRIGAILGASEVFRETKTLEDDEARLIDIISRNARLMKTSVENLLVLSRASQEVTQHKNVLLAQSAHEALRQVRDLARDAGVELRVAELPDVEVNAAAVELCLTNYLSNAIKYADAHRTNRYAEITASLRSHGDEGEVEVRVRDNGVGVPPGERDRLFQRFFRSRGATESGAEGTGLGLSIVREAAESLGGRAWAEFPGEGSVFAFSLPYHRAVVESGSGRGTDAA
jgi:signal transduction histidine kinase